MTTGMASPATLRELWVSLLENLLSTMKEQKRPPVDLLQVSRKFLRDNAYVAPDTASSKDLEALYRLYSKALHDALTGPNPRAGVLSEARHWLTYHGIKPDLPASQVAAVAKKLGELDMPFTTKH